MVSLRYFAPADDVCDLVSVYYLLEVEEPSFSDRERAAIAQLRFLLEGTAEVTFANGNSCHGHGAMLVGPSTGAMTFTLNGPLRMFGAGLLPAGWAAMTSASAADYTDTAVQASQILGPEVDKNIAVFNNCASPEDMVAWADKMFRAIKPRVKPQIWEFTHMVDAWLASDPSPPVGALMDRAPYSSRQVLRLVNKLYGLPPKYLARKYRALRAARAFAEQNTEDLLALEDAFYDQSHMIREIKFFAGTTPTRLRVEEGEMALLIDQRKTLKGRIAPTTSDT